jgi:signal transduction histidine kinase/CheY-like chemotaxis protein
LARTPRNPHDPAGARAAGVLQPSVTQAWGFDHLMTWLFLPAVIAAWLAGLWLGRKRGREEEGRAPSRTREAGTSDGLPSRDLTAQQPPAIGKTIAEALDLPEVGQRIVDSVRQMLRARAAGLHSLEPSGIMPTIAVSGDVRTTWAANRVYPPGTGAIGRAVAEDRMVMTPDSLADPRINYPADFAERLREAGYRAILAVPLAVEGQTVGVLAVGDMVGRVFTDEEIQLVQAFAAQAALAFANARLYEEAKRRRAEAERASQAKDELLAMLGHELRNPLGAIANAVHVLGTAGVSEVAARRARDVIARQSSHLARLVDDLVDAGRMLTGKVTLEPLPTELTRIVTHAVTALSAAGRTLEHRIECHLADKVWVRADETRMEQVITDLIANALNYTPSGGTIRLTVKKEPAAAVFEVMDTGQGIEPELLPRVFDLFVQGERGLERVGGGLGIGLTLVKRLVELHGGTIGAYSEGRGAGSVFTMRLPLLDSALPESQPAGPASAAGLHVLVVEDHEDSREMLRHLLERAGYRVSQAADGPTAVAEALRLRPDVALIDVGLPGLDGYEVAKRIREARMTQTRLIALSGFGRPQDRSRAHAAGFDDHLVKPVSLERLVGALARGPHGA